MKPARLMKIAALSASALLLTGGGVVASIPALRHIAVALAHDPAGLSPVPGDPRVRFEEGAENCAFGVAALLPRAIAAVEAAMGGRFDTTSPSASLRRPNLTPAPMASARRSRVE